MFNCVDSCDPGPAIATRTVAITICGENHRVPVGISAASAWLLCRERIANRTTAITGQSRAPLCLMGVCFECLMEINGEPNQQACLIAVEEGMVINPQRGSRQC
jgi:predicted molibdopterin-dependent oxidoreductase YjgC